MRYSIFARRYRLLEPIGALIRSAKAVNHSGAGCVVEDEFWKSAKQHEVAVFSLAWLP
jgi:hypothetical protein